MSLYNFHKSVYHVFNIPFTILIYRFGLAHIGRVGSVMLTLSITIERYCSVCHSTCQFRAKSLLLPLPVAFAIIYNIPKFFELKSETFHENLWDQVDPSDNKTLMTQMIVSYNDTTHFNLSNYTTPEPTIIIVGTGLRRNPWYIIIYVFWSNFLLVKIVPYVLMIVMNILIWRSIQEFAKVRRNALGINEGKTRIISNDIIKYYVI